MRIDSDQIPEGPPWTPAVWKSGPDVLVSQAQSQLFVDQQDMESVLDGGDRAMAGGEQADQNESDQMIDQAAQGSTMRSSTDSQQGRATEWANSVKDLYRDEPLAAWSSGAHDGPANPAP